MKSVATMSPAEYREARAAFLREPAQASQPGDLPDDVRQVGDMTHAEYETARQTYIDGE